MMSYCGKCSKCIGVLMALFGIGFLVQDLTPWTFWGLNWWSVGFLLFGLATLGSACCKDCQSCCGGCEMPATAKKKK